MKYFPVVLIMFSGAVYGAENCSQIGDMEDRLACYDKRYPRTEPTAPQSTAKTEVTPVPEKVSSQPAAVASTTTAAALTGNKQPQKQSRWKLFGKRDIPDINATIEGVYNKDKQKMVFQLSNKQIWLQTSPRSLPIREGDKVTIKNAIMGGYILRTESGTSTRVSLVE